MTVTGFAKDHRHVPEDRYADAKVHVDEVEHGIWRLSLVAGPQDIPGGFTYNCYLIDDDEPLLYHTGKRGMFPLFRAAVERIVPMERLRYISFAHGEADECGAMNYFLEAAPNSTIITNKLGRMIHVGDRAIRDAKIMAHGETLSLGQHSIQWIDTPHMPHCWDSAMIAETTTRTLFCGDLLTQLGGDKVAVVEHDLIVETEAARAKMPYVSDPKGARPHLDAVAATKPQLLAAMHGSAWRGDGQALLRALADAWARG